MHNFLSKIFVMYKGKILVIMGLYLILHILDTIEKKLHILYLIPDSATVY